MLRRRPLMRMAATTAVVAGTATAVSGRVGRRQEAKAQEQAAANAPQPEYAPEPEPMAPPAGGLTEDSIERLKELAALKEQGVLTEEEFAAEKAKLLA
jgi:Short C-terminal domain